MTYSHYFDILFEINDISRNIPKNTRSRILKSEMRRKRSIEKNGCKKSLAEILAENIQRDDADTATRRQAVVLSLWEEVCDAYNHGWSYREIWRGLEREGTIDFSYSTFQHYIRKIRRRLVEAERGTSPSTDGNKTKVNQTAAAKPAAPPPVASAIVPGSTRVDIPKFGQGLPPRDTKKF